MALVFREREFPDGNPNRDALLAAGADSVVDEFSRAAKTVGKEAVEERRQPAGVFFVTVPAFIGKGNEKFNRIPVVKIASPALKHTALKHVSASGEII